jgi:hypothetical protein
MRNRNLLQGKPAMVTFRRIFHAGIRRATAAALLLRCGTTERADGRETSGGAESLSVDSTQKGGFAPEVR